MATELEQEDNGDGLEKYRQKRRRPRPERTEPSSVPRSERVDRAFDLIPETGEGKRWYDSPYRALRWLLSGRTGKMLPRSFRTYLGDHLNALLQYNAHDRNWVWPRDSEFDNLFVPEDEVVKLGGICVVELFPPAELPALERALKRKSWTKRPRRSVFEDENSAALNKSRSGNGYLWWRIGEVKRPDSRLFVPDAVPMDLPQEFELVGISALQIGPSLTAVIARFDVSESARDELNEVWHTDHDPTLLKAKVGLPRALDRRWAGIWHTQRERKRIHDLVRSWLTKQLPGFFSSVGKPLPVLDLLVMSKLDPTSEDDEEISEQTRRYNDSYEALGLDADHLYRLQSAQMRGLLLSTPLDTGERLFRGSPTWTLWGQQKAIVDGMQLHRLGEGADSARGIFNWTSESMYGIFAMMAVQEFLRSLQEEYSKLRDGARISQGKFRPRALKRLRSELLRLSIDTVSLKRDIDSFWNRPWSFDGVPDFSYHLSPRARRRDAENGRAPEEPRSFNAGLKDCMSDSLERLIEYERSYREILSTVASLGASADSYRVSRIALGISILTLIVAIIAMVVAGR